MRRSGVLSTGFIYDIASQREMLPRVSGIVTVIVRRCLGSRCGGFITVRKETGFSRNFVYEHVSKIC